MSDRQTETTVRDLRTTVPVDIFACVDNHGDYGVGIDVDAAREDYEARVGDLSECEGFRIIKVIVVVPLPEMPTLKGTAPDVGEAALKSVE
jgi:hypothetical protein